MERLEYNEEELLKLIDDCEKREEVLFGLAVRHDRANSEERAAMVEADPDLEDFLPYYQAQKSVVEARRMAPILEGNRILGSTALVGANQ